MIKYSRQRECILKDLQSRRDHPTADMVYESVKDSFPNISLGTVYRNLSMLAENGTILKISTENGPDHFDGFTEPHTHFVCRNCGNVLDMDYVPDGDIIKNASEDFQGKIDEYKLLFVGTCKGCLSEE